MKRRTGIDIIIPVYNALSDLKLCIESILKYTDLSLDRVILIDDKSPDENVYPYLKSIEQPGIEVLQNEENRGFSGTINRGILYSDRDVLLLNTDTIVTARWIDKITACAYSDPAIGTVTPFSNNATLCSIPNFCEENTIPNGLTIDEYAQLIERCSMKDYPKITVAVGFCMFIKREVIEKAGLFDEQTFQKGYGEENDFCWRAEQLGYRHVLCDDTYIYHSGTASFVSKEKRKLMADHEKILTERYPEQIQQNSEYVRDNPHQYLRSNVEIYSKLKNGKRNILYVLHYDFRSNAINNIGGTQLHVSDLTMELRRDYNIFVLARDGETLRVTAYLEQDEMSFQFHIGKKETFQPFHSEAIAKAFREILVAFSIDLVHVHHVIDLSFDVFSVTKTLGIPLVLTMHDYYFICPTVNLMENGETYCGGCGKNCQECLNKLKGYTKQVSYLPVWQEKCRQALELCDALVTPSNAAKEVFRQVYPETAERIHVIPHGLDPFEVVTLPLSSEPTAGCRYQVEHAFESDYTVSGWAYQEGWESCNSEIFILLEDKEGKRCRYRTLAVERKDVAKGNENDSYSFSGFTARIPDSYFATGELKLQLLIRNGGREAYSKTTVVKGYTKREKNRKRIAFLGGLNQIKGSQIAYQMIKQSGDKYDWYIIGLEGDADLITLQKKNVYHTGRYKREDVCSILQQNQIDLVCILPICLETFCYTFSEAELAGVPILAADIGALGERMRESKTGWLIEPNAPTSEILSTIDRIFEDQTQYAQIMERFKEFQHKSISEMCGDYDRLYKTFALPDARPSDYDARAIYHAYVACQAGSLPYGAGSNMELIRRVQELETSLFTINQSIEYRMVKFFNRENIPFKRQIKWLIGVAYRIYKRLRR